MVLQASMHIHLYIFILYVCSGGPDKTVISRKTPCISRALQRPDWYITKGTRIDMLDALHKTQQHVLATILIPRPVPSWSLNIHMEMIQHIWLCTMWNLALLSLPVHMLLGLSWAFKAAADVGDTAVTAGDHSLDKWWPTEKECLWPCGNREGVHQSEGTGFRSSLKSERECFKCLWIGSSLVPRPSHCPVFYHLEHAVCRPGNKAKF